MGKGKGSKGKGMGNGKGKGKRVQYSPLRGSSAKAGILASYNARLTALTVAFNHEHLSPDPRRRLPSGRSKVVPPPAAVK
jgi:hypothetical protein